jgi:hypothetical protein
LREGTADAVLAAHVIADVRRPGCNGLAFVEQERGESATPFAIAHGVRVEVQITFG